MNLLPLAQKLEDDGVGIQGRTVFINMMPVESAILIILLLLVLVIQPLRL